MFNPFNSPIIRKDTKVISRSMKFSWGLFAYEAVLGLIFLITMSVYDVSTRSFYNLSNANVYSGYMYFFASVGAAQIGIIALVVPIITASSISGERERKTMDVLLTTITTPTSIILGKIGSAVIRVMTFVVASIPLMSVAFIFGGLSWLKLLEYVIIAFFFACLTGSIGILCSAICKKSITAIILSYVMYLGLYGLPFIIWLCEFLVKTSRRTYILAPTVMTIDPVYSILVFFVSCYSDIDALEPFVNTSNVVIDFFNNPTVWVTLSIIVQSCLMIFFIVMAAKRIRPGKN